MKHLLLVFLVIFTISCDKTDKPSPEYGRSYQSWLNFKSESADSYIYVVTGGSWVGTSWSTETTIEAGQVVKRKFTYESYGDVIKPETGWDETSSIAALESINLTAEEFMNQKGMSILEYLSWEESEEALGTHQNTPAAELLTLDQVYDKARTEWLMSRDNTTTYFENENNGMISLCGYTENNCADDCFIGISISSIVAKN